MSSIQESIALMQMEHVPLATDFQCDEQCGNPGHFEHYLRYNAMSDSQAGVGVTHIFLGRSEDGTPVKIIGFVSIKANSVISERDNGYDGQPAIEIAEVAVDKRWSRQGIGTILVKYALALVDEIRKKIGVKYVIVCADELAVGFYEKVGFKPLSTLYEIPREGWNAGCVPMCIDLTIPAKPVYDDDDDF